MNWVEKHWIRPWIKVFYIISVSSILIFPLDRITFSNPYYNKKILKKIQDISRLV